MYARCYQNVLDLLLTFSALLKRNVSFSCSSRYQGTSSDDNSGEGDKETNLATLL